MGGLMEALAEQDALRGSPELSDAALTGSSSRKVTAPAPNPTFSFPSLPPPSETDNPVESSSRIPSPLNLSMQSSMSSLVGAARLDGPQVSPNRANFGPPRTGGHRRGGSEFIGGDGKTGTGLMSTSPTKGEGVLPSPPASIGRRRGHAHRRSGAISHHDLSGLAKPREPISLPEKPGSLPSSPTVSHPPTLDRSISHPALKSTQAVQALMDAVSKPPGEDAPSVPPPTRPRVGFSDTLEFIPRPLSTISSETSSSMSTIRATHSVSGSITSLMSIGTSSPPSAKKNQYTHDVLQRYRQGSPKPASVEFMEKTSQLEDSPTQVRRPSSPDAGRVLKALAGKEPLDIDAPSPVTDEFSTAQDNQPSTDNEPASLWRHPPAFTAFSLKNNGSNAEVQERPRSSPETKSTKRQKKVKTWAESFLSLRAKGKLPDDIATSAESPSSQTFAPMQDFSLDDVNFDEDTSCVINSPGYVPPPPSKSPPMAVKSRFDETESETPGAIFDLDAAWDELDDKEIGGSVRLGKKRLHSSNSNPNFVGNGPQYHRRAESAPALTPMTSFVRRANESQMADVFEEDEDETPTEAKQETNTSRPSTSDKDLGDEMNGLGVTVVEHESASDPASAPEGTIPPTLPRHDENDADQRSALSQNSEVQTPRDIPELSDLPVEIVDTVDEPRFSVITKSSDESTVTPTLPGSPPQELQRDVAALALPYAYPERHAISMPEAISFAAPPGRSSTHETRVSTMSSLHTDTSTLASKPHDMGTAQSYSTEDVPSLTSSASTTASVRAGHLASTPLPRPSADRSHSFSGMPRRTRNVSAVKRASLASLSRLVGVSYAERSKLSLEVLSYDNQEKSEKKKRHRLSKLVKFWKSKDKTAIEA